MSGHWTVFVQFKDSKRAERLAPNGSTTTKRLHAAMIEDKAKAERIATEIMAENAETVVKAWAARF